MADLIEKSRRQASGDKGETEPAQASPAQRDVQPDAPAQEPNDAGGDNASDSTTKKLMVVGLGASAGGIKALERFFQEMPASSNMAFVVILHLSPQHESNLAMMLQRHTSMPVKQVAETIIVERNHVYVIPPAKQLVMYDGSIQLQEPQKDRHAPIDIFFRTLADAYKIHSIGIVLSGTGTDGTLGLRRIKEHGGIALAQDPSEAEHDGMPLSAINSDVVDFVLRVDEMPRKLLGIRQATERIQIPPEGEKPPTGGDADALVEVLTLLRVRTRHDFTSYKHSTVVRRISRRLQVNEVDDLRGYVRFIREHPSELQELLSDLLITVTNFFRDPEAFESLDLEVIPSLFANKGEGHQVRVWVPGCATGEEAYSLAILLLEHAARLPRPCPIQIFASDIDEESIAQAREGLYPETIAADVAPDRLRRFFVRENLHYRVKKEVREIVLFAPHNLLRDPPFSRLDLISCRNLLIYLNRNSQERVLELFHFAIRPGGYLFLGTSESADGSELFTAVDKKRRVFKRSTVSGDRPYPPPALPVQGKWDVKMPDIEMPGGRIVSYADLHQAILEQYAPPSVLVNSSHDVVHLSPNSGRYLRFGGGEPNRNLMRLVHPDLRLDLRAALYAAAQEGRPAETRRVRVPVEGQFVFLKIAVRPTDTSLSAHGFLAVVFTEESGEESASSRPAAEASAGRDTELESVVRRLEDELQHSKDQLRAAIEQHETSAEELKASNEELQAMNEELRSATEELETSKEELQSVNEELTTVNVELKDKVDQVIHANSDLQNLLAATDIGTIFLDRRLYVKRFTPKVQDLFNLIPSDVGRPLGDITHKLEYGELPGDAEHVLKTLTKQEREVRSTKGRYFIVRLLPYRTIDDRIEGVVLTFVDITERKHAEEERARLRYEVEATRSHLEDVLKSMPAGVIVMSPEGQVMFCNHRAEEIFGRGIPPGTNVEEYSGQMHDPATRKPYAQKPPPGIRAITDGKVISAERATIARPDGTERQVTIDAVPIGDKSGNIVYGVSTYVDVTELQAVEARLREFERATAEGEKELAQAHTRTRDMLGRIVGAQEIERKRISRDLHDHLGQHLTALRLSLESLKAQAGKSGAIGPHIERLEQTVARIDQDVDFLTWELRPAALGELGLATALDNFVNEWSKHFGIAAEFHAGNLGSDRLTPEAEISLYRVAQEALNNVAKHAGATHVEVLLERRQKSIVLIVEDNGIGFDPGKDPDQRAVGLGNMRERSELIGGTLYIESTPDEGTSIFVRIPVSGEGGEEN